MAAELVAGGPVPAPQRAIVGLPSLEACERKIEAGLDTFVEVGTALLTIRDVRLYRKAGFTSFESYCQERWSLKVAHAKRFIEAAQVVQMLAPNGSHLPSNERQARALVPLKDDPAALTEAWNDANEIADERGQRVSHRIIEQVVARATGKAPTNDSGHAWARKGERVAATVIANLVAVSQSIASLDVADYRATQDEVEGLDRTIKALRKLRNSLVIEK